MDRVQDRTNNSTEVDNTNTTTVTTAASRIFPQLEYGLKNLNELNDIVPDFLLNVNSTQAALFYNLEVAQTQNGTESFGGSGTAASATAAISSSPLSSTEAYAENVIVDWKEICVVGLLCTLIVITVIGNTLVILAVITTRRLRTVTNCFVMSLAVADWLVGLFVIPPAIAVRLMGTWQLGSILCDIWISLDVLLCTASILSLCAISIDRYLAVTQPLNYSRRRRSKRLALLMILVVWVLALLITCPPILGWYEEGRQEHPLECRYNQNEGYVVFSAMGSFFIPMAVMLYVYLKISCVVAARHDEMAEIEVHKKSTRIREIDLDAEIEFSEHEPSTPHGKRSSGLTTPTLNTINTKSDLSSTNDVDNLKSQHKNGHYELVDTTRVNAPKRNATVTYKQTANHAKWPNSGHYHQQSVRNVNTSSECTVSKNVRVHQKSLSNRISSLKRENKTTQTLSIVVGGFIVCWLPFFIYYLITPFLPHELVSPLVTSLFTWIGWINSAINPFIYAFYSVDFRAAFWRLTLRRFFKNPRKLPFTATTVSIRR